MKCYLKYGCSTGSCEPFGECYYKSRTLTTDQVAAIVPHVSTVCCGDHFNCAEQDRECVHRQEALATSRKMANASGLTFECVSNSGVCHHLFRCGVQNDCMDRPSATKIDPNTPPANPKQHYGDKKLPLYLVPFTFVAQVCTALFEGKVKYGLVNWRASKVEAMTYVSACKRHIDKWTNGERCDPVTKVHHLANAAACLCIVMDAEVSASLIDDRPLPIPQAQADAMLVELEATIANLRVLYGDKHPKHYMISDVTP